MQTFTILLIVFFVVIGIMVALRSMIGEEFQPRNSDVLIALIPIAVWLVISGKVKVIEFAGFKIESALKQASAAPIEEQVNKLPVERLERDPKRGVNVIPKLIQKKTEALTFFFGRGWYDGPAIKKFLKELTAYPFFKYVVINRSDGRFFAMVDARTLFSHLSSREGPGFQTFADWVNESNESALKKNIPDLIFHDLALEPSTGKQEALKRMETNRVEILPVTDDNDRLVGMVERNRLLASLIIEVAEQVR